MQSVDAGCGASTLSGLQTGAKHANHHHRPTQAQLVLASELGRCTRRVGRPSWQGAEMAPLTLIKDGGNMATFAADFFPPDFSQWQDYLTEMAVTLQIAVWGTALAVVLSIPLWPDERRKPGAVVGLPARSPPDGRLPRH